MEFEIKDYKLRGSVISHVDNKFKQVVYVRVGVKNNPHEKMFEERLIDYIFNETLTAKQISDGLEEFLEEFITEEYPSIQ